MKTMRMPKGWILVGTSDLNYGRNESREAKLKRDHNFRKLIRNTEKLPLEKLMDETEKEYNKLCAYNTQLLKAFHDKKLKSKDLIKRAKKLSKTNTD